MIPTWILPHSGSSEGKRISLSTQIAYTCQGSNSSLICIKNRNFPQDALVDKRVPDNYSDQVIPVCAGLPSFSTKIPMIRETPHLLFPHLLRVQRIYCKTVKSKMAEEFESLNDSVEESTLPLKLSWATNKSLVLSIYFCACDTLWYLNLRNNYLY